MASWARAGLLQAHESFRAEARAANWWARFFTIARQVMHHVAKKNGSKQVAALAAAAVKLAGRYPDHAP
eukprot:103349-Pyramimonas_sp.AAC.1